MTRLDLPPLRQVLASAGIVADRRLGQNFLLDLNICRKIVRLAEVAPGATVIEVGPGPGGLTRALLEAGARVVAVEKDERFLPMLEALAAGAGGALRVVHADALAANEASLAQQGAIIVANLPYNVGTPLLIKWLVGPFRPASMTLMFQSEVARRIVAPPGGSDYGRLSVLAQALCECRIVLDLPARAFTPPPKVASAVVRLTPQPVRPRDKIVAALQDVTRAAFGQRRKMLRSALRDLGGEALCAKVGIDAGARAESVPVAGFIALAEAVAAQARPAPAVAEGDGSVIVADKAEAFSRIGNPNSLQNPISWIHSANRRSALSSRTPDPRQLSLGPGFDAELMHRLLFAVWPDAAAISKIASLAAPLRTEKIMSGRLVEPGRLHVTLLHFGDFPDSIPPSLIAAALAAAATVMAEPFEVGFDRVIGARGRLLLRPSDELAPLRAFHQSLKIACMKAGLRRYMTKPFQPHLTLSYDPSDAPASTIEPIIWTVRKFTLVESLLGKHRHIERGIWSIGP